MSGVRARDAEPLMCCIFVQYVSCGFASAPPHPFALPLLDPFPHRLIDCAVKQSDFEMVRFLVGAGVDVNWAVGRDSRFSRRRICPLDCAVRNGDVEMVRFLVGAGAYVNAVLHYG